VADYFLQHGQGGREVVLGGEYQEWLMEVAQLGAGVGEHEVVEQVARRGKVGLLLVGDVSLGQLWDGRGRLVEDDAVHHRVAAAQGVHKFAERRYPQRVGNDWSRPLRGYGYLAQERQVEHLPGDLVAVLPGVVYGDGS